MSVNKKVFINHNWCKQCGICVHLCPKAVLELRDGKLLASKEEKCIQCMMCQNHCPDFAIEIKEEKAK
ncbi:hypothetical protein BHF68_03210 [Desulfuribacillus alkaliarsenatis]|uniref:4Fe-4S ferredoxin-type domain-containing protein n=1 Tax=Desulfuribacillus alkaliarsenatis TaxID=766136 RepID=A0A1E5G699_9FIRM|nr:hypothetical protein BHF68_03210 [Desulfuribacillus alkaliarsenatis]